MSIDQFIYFFIFFNFFFLTKVYQSCWVFGNDNSRKNDRCSLRNLRITHLLGLSKEALAVEDFFFFHPLASQAKRKTHRGDDERSNVNMSKLFNQDLIQYNLGDMSHIPFIDRNYFQMTEPYKKILFHFPNLSIEQLVKERHVKN